MYKPILCIKNNNTSEILIPYEKQEFYMTNIWNSIWKNIVKSKYTRANQMEC